VNLAPAEREVGGLALVQAVVYAQEYLAEFVDWSGVAFFSREKLLADNLSLPVPPWCEGVFAVRHLPLQNLRTGGSPSIGPPSESRLLQDSLFTRVDFPESYQ
jgi:hypothetical protein